MSSNFCMNIQKNFCIYIWSRKSERQHITQTPIPKKVTVDLEIVIRAVPGAFVRVSLSSVALLTGTHLGVPFRLNFALRV